MPDKIAKSLLDATGEEVLDLKWTNRDFGDWWVLSDGYHVSICEQKVGNVPTQGVRVPIKTMRQIVKFLTREQNR